MHNDGKRFAQDRAVRAAHSKSKLSAADTFNDYRSVSVFAIQNYRMRSKADRVWVTVAFLLCCCGAASAQTQSAPAATEPPFIVPARPTVSNPAEFQKPGVLQLESGYNANLHASGVSSEQDTPIAIRFAASSRVLLEADIDAVISQTATGQEKVAGFGDCQFGIQTVLLHEHQTSPGVALAYYIKTPTASSTNGLGTGRVDHNFIALVSKTVDRTTLDLNAICFLAGRTSGKGHTLSGQGAFAVSEALTKRFGVQGEISGFSRNDEQRGAMVGLSVATYQVNERLVLDAGVRFGLTHGAPSTGFVAGMTVGVSDLYRKKH